MSLTQSFPLARPAHRAGTLPVAPWWLAIPWHGALAYAWWATALDQLAGMPRIAAAAGPGNGLAIVAVHSVVGRYAGLLFETAFYTAAWAGLGARLGFFRTGGWIVSLSALDLLSAALRDLVTDGHETLAPWLAPVAGLALVQPADANGLWVGFGSLGLLTALRVVLTARVQAAALGRPIAAPLALTVATWLATRVLLWWGFDLARGMSGAS